MIRDKDYSIISCSPENLITKKGSLITTKPIAGTVKKNKKMNKNNEREVKKYSGLYLYLYNTISHAREELQQ